LVLQGCGFAKFIYFEPTPIGFARPHYKGPPPSDAGCAVAPDSIYVPVDAGVTVKLSVRKGTFDGGGYTDAPGTTLFGEAFVPSGIRVRFVTDTFTFIAVPGQEQQKAIAKFTRSVFVQKRNGNATWFDPETQTVSPADTLVGWASEHGNYDNLFSFVVPFEKFVDPAFTVRMPDMEVDGRLVTGKSVSFKYIEKRQFVTIMESLCS